MGSDDGGAFVMEGRLDEAWIALRVRLPESIGGGRFLSTLFWRDGYFVHRPRVEDSPFSGRNEAGAVELQALLAAPDALRGASSGSPKYDPTYVIEVRSQGAVRRAQYCYEIEMGAACGVTQSDHCVLSMLLRPK